jgi:transposase
VLESLVVKPPSPEQAVRAVDGRGLPGVDRQWRLRQRAKAAGFRLRAPKRGQKQAGVGKVCNVVERCHNFFAQFGRIARRLDRSAKRYLGWLQMAACVILVRSGFSGSPYLSSAFFSAATTAFTSVSLIVLYPNVAATF